MTDEKVVQLAEQVRGCFRNVPPSVDLNGTVTTYQDEIVKCALEAAYDVGRRDGPEWVKCSEREPDEEGRYLIQYQQHGQVRIFIGDYLPGDGWSCRVNDMEVLQWQKIVPPASISSSANSVEGKKE